MSFLQTPFAALCLLFLALPLYAERIDDSSDIVPPPPKAIGGKSFEQWLKDLKHPDPSVRGGTIPVLLQFREKAMDAVPLLIERIRDKDDATRLKAVLAFKIIGVRAADIPSAVKALGHCLAHDGQPIVRYEAAQALSRFGSDIRDVVKDLAQGVGDSSTWEIRYNCINVLLAGGVDAKNGPASCVTDALFRRLIPANESAQMVRLRAVFALGFMGRPKDPKNLTRTIDGLMAPAIYQSPNKFIQIWSRVSLMALRDNVNEKDLKSITDYLEDDERDVRVQAITALGALQKKADDSVLAIVRFLQKEKDANVLMAACNALGGMGNRSKPIVAALLDLARREEEASISMVLSACMALMQLNMADKEVKEILERVLDRKNPKRPIEEPIRDVIRKSVVEMRRFESR